MVCKTIQASNVKLDKTSLACCIALSKVFFHFHSWPNFAHLHPLIPQPHASSNCLLFWSSGDGQTTLLQTLGSAANLSEISIVLGWHSFVAVILAQGLAAVTLMLPTTGFETDIPVTSEDAELGCFITILLTWKLAEFSHQHSLWPAIAPRRDVFPYCVLCVGCIDTIFVFSFLFIFPFLSFSYSPEDMFIDFRKRGRLEIEPAT